MAIAYTWKVTGLKVTDTDDHDKVVIQSFWTKTGTDENGFTGVFEGTTSFSVDEIVDNQFIPYHNLTEKTVLTWIQDREIGPFMERVDDRIAKEISIKIAPPVIGVPW
jgi:hypothetical protein